MKQIRIGKVILHTLVGRLSINNIKTAYNVSTTLEEINSGKVNIKKILAIKPRDILVAVEFNNRYTNFEKITLEAYIDKFIAVIQKINNPKLNNLIGIIQAARNLNTILHTVKGD